MDQRGDLAFLWCAMWEGAISNKNDHRMFIVDDFSSYGNSVSSSSSSFFEKKRSMWWKTKGSDQVNETILPAHEFLNGKMDFFILIYIHILLLKKFIIFIKWYKKKDDTFSFSFFLSLCDAKKNFPWCFLSFSSLPSPRWIIIFLSLTIYCIIILLCFFFYFFLFFRMYPPIINYYIWSTIGH